MYKWTLVDEEDRPSIDILLQRTPLPEVCELDFDDGWMQWDLAVKLIDKNHDV